MSEFIKICLAVVFCIGGQVQGAVLIDILQYWKHTSKLNLTISQPIHVVSSVVIDTTALFSSVAYSIKVF